MFLFLVKRKMVLYPLHNDHCREAHCAYQSIIYCSELILLEIYTTKATIYSSLQLLTSYNLHDKMCYMTRVTYSCGHSTADRQWVCLRGGNCTSAEHRSQPLNVNQQCGQYDCMIGDRWRAVNQRMHAAPTQRRRNSPSFRDASHDRRYSYDRHTGHWQQEESRCRRRSRSPVRRSSRAHGNSFNSQYQSAFEQMMGSIMTGHQQNDRGCERRSSRVRPSSSCRRH